MSLRNARGRSRFFRVFFEKSSPLEAGLFGEGALTAQRKRAADSRPYENRRVRSVGADAFIGPNPPQAGLFDGSVLATRPYLPPAGNFSPQKSSQNAPGAAAPGLPWGCAACIPRKGIARAVTLHRAVPSHTACPFSAPRGPVKSDGRYGYRGFLKGRTDCLGTEGGLCTRQFLRNFSISP